MALIACPECGKQISDRASVCIHCGYPLASITPNYVAPQNVTAHTANTDYPKCPSCGHFLQKLDAGIYHCARCDNLYTETDITRKAHLPQDKEFADAPLPSVRTNTRKRKGWLVVLAILVMAFVAWKILGPKTVESGNGWKHQIADFDEPCGFITCDSKSSTHRIHSTFIEDDYYCDECWEQFGQRSFDFLAEKESKSSSSDDATTAKICAVKAVKDNLKSPSTAEFCSYPDMTATNLGGNNWKVTGYVDAQNSFGATLRENWTVTLTLTDSGFTDYTVTFD